MPGRKSRPPGGLIAPTREAGQPDGILGSWDLCPGGTPRSAPACTRSLSATPHPGPRGYVGLRGPAGDAEWVASRLATLSLSAG